MFDVLKYVTETAKAYDTEPRFVFRGQSTLSPEAGVIPVEFDELSDREREYYRTGPWSTRPEYRKGQLVQPGPGRPGYQGKEHHLKGVEPWNKGKTYKLQSESWKGNIEIPKGKVTVAELIDLVGSERLNIDTFAQGRKQEKPSYVYNKIAKLLNEKKIDYRPGKTGLYYLYDKPSKAQIKELQTFIDSPLLQENTVKSMKVFNKAFADYFEGKGKEFPTLEEARAALKKQGIKATDAQMARAMMRLGQSYQGHTFRNEVPIQLNRIGGNFITKSFNEMDQFHPWRSASYDAALDDIARNMPKEAGNLRSFKNTYTEYMRKNFPQYKGVDLNEIFSVTTSANRESYPYSYFVDLTKSAVNRKQLSGFQGKASLAEGKIIDNIKKYRSTGDIKYYNEAVRVKNKFNNVTRKNFLSSEKIKKLGGVNAVELELGSKYQILNKSNIAKDFYAKNTLNKWKDLGIDIAGHSADAGYVKLGATAKGTIPIQELFTPESRLSGKKVMVASTLNKFLKANGVDICG